METEYKSLLDFGMVEPTSDDSLICGRGRLLISDILDLAKVEKFSYIKLAVNNGDDGEYAYLGLAKLDGKITFKIYTAEEVE